MDIIKVSNVKKSFGSHVILDGVDFNFEDGKCYSLIGKSGCGKSTLLRCLNGLEILDSGKIEVDGIILENHDKKLREKCHEVRGHVGMVFQSFQLFPHMSLLDNVKRPMMIIKKIGEGEAEVRAMEYLQKVHLSAHVDKYPYQLSGGQQQRGSIARALALKPKVMLYDEPTSALDPELVDEVHQVIRDLDNETITQIVVTHEMSFARDVADNVIYMDHGKIIESGPANELFSNPKHELTRQYLRKYL